MRSKRFFFLASLLSAFLLSMQPVQAQYYGKHPWDAKFFNLGFTMGLNYNALNLKEQIDICERGVCLNRIEPIPRMGLSMGIISNFNLHEHVNLRFIPTVSLEQRDFDYFFQGADQDSVIQRKIEASYLNLPLLFMFRARYWKRSRFYVVTGPQLGINFGSNKKVRDDQNLLKITTMDFSLIFGAGLNLYGDRIKLSPEIRYSMGLRNIYVPEFTSHATAISLLYNQQLSLIVNFE
ncbi:MAG: porin family protein [Bacteroidota bacterium]